MAIIKTFILTLLLLSVVVAQPLTDILVNDEPDSNCFFAQDASVHYFPPDKFLAIWHESRSNDNFGYARFFNAQMQPLSDMFRVLGNEVLLPDKNDRYTIMQHFTRSGPPDMVWIGYYQDYSFTQPQNPPTMLDVWQYPPCGSGFLGMGSDLVLTLWGSIHFVNFGGYLKWMLRENGQTSFEWDSVYLPESYIPLGTVISFDLVPTADSLGAFLVLCSIDDSFKEYVPPGLYLAHIGQQTTRLTITPILLDSTLKSFSTRSCLVKASLTDDKVINIYWIRDDTLSHIKVDTSGAIQAISKVFIPYFVSSAPSPKNRYFYAMFVTNMLNGERFLAMTCHQSSDDPGQEGYGWIIFKLLENELADEEPRIIRMGSWWPSTTRGDIVLLHDGDLLAGGVRDYQAFVFRMTGDRIAEEMKLSLDQPGAHQEHPGILPVSDAEFCISYDELSRTRGRRLDMNGGFASDATNMPAPNGLFLDNGNVYVVLQRSPDASFKSALQFYNAWDWSLRLEVGLAEFISELELAKLDTNRFFVAARIPEGGAAIRVYDATGTLVDSLLQRSEREGRLYGTDIYPLPDGKFWIHTNGYFLWDVAAHSLSEAVNLNPYYSGFAISDSLFVKVNISYKIDQQAFFSTYSIVSTSQSVLVEDQTISDGDRCIDIIPLDETYFLIFYQTNDSQYHFAVFDHSFQVVFKGNPFPLASPHIKDGTVGKVGDHLVFAASDIRNNLTGQDVFASIYAIRDIITGVSTPSATDVVPADFQLSEPAPNPAFRGRRMSMTIEMHKDAFVETSIYNVLGQRVGNPRRRFFPAGTFRIDFDWNGYVAGVYFIRVATGQQAIIKKVAVMR